MYRNPYTMAISAKVDENNRRLVSHLNREMMDSFEGSGSTSMTSKSGKCQCGGMPCRCVKTEEGMGMSGGSGFASGTKNDSGFEPTIGAGGGKGSKTYRKKGCGQIASLPPPENVFELGNVGAGAGMRVQPIEEEPKADRRAKEKLERVVGGKKHTGKTHIMPDGTVMLDSEHKMGKGSAELKADLGKFDFNRLKDYIGLAKPKELMDFKRHTGMRGKGFEELKADLRKFDANRIKDYVGLGRYGKKYMKGSGFFDSIASFFKQFPEKVNSVLMPIAGKIADTVNTVRSKVGLGGYRNVPQVVKEKSQMVPTIGGAKSDGRKKRAEIVKKVMREKGMKMIEASKYVKQHNLY